LSGRDRFLVVGLGSIGRRHLANLRQLRPNSRLAVLRRTGGENGPADLADEVFHSLEAALAFEPKAAVIASPAPFHAEMARALLSAGIAVLIEKPVSDGLAGAEGLSASVARSGAAAMIGYNLRFEPAVQCLRELLRTGAAGDVRLARGYVGQYLPDWRPGQDYRDTVSARRALGGGPLLELSHEIDLACWLLGAPDAVHCRGGRYSDLAIDVEDAVELALEHSHPQRLTVLGLNFLDRTPTRRLSLIGSEGTITWDGIARRVTLERGPGSEAQLFDFTRGDRNDAYLAELEHFLACVEEGVKPAIAVKDGLRVLEVVEAARESMRTGAGVSLKKGL
jgi:predicted dehydrogenase